MIKRIIKQQLLRRRGIKIDLKTNINYSVKVNKTFHSTDFKPIIIKESNVQFTEVGEGCFLEYVCAYGNIELGRFVSISGPGTILHSEVGKIKIGSFTSIAENVSIQEFNHQLDKASTFALHHNVFCNEKKKDWTSKGDVEIGEDVWIGSNVVILSGIKIGRGCVCGAGSVVTKDIPPYAIVVGNPARVIKYRFSQKVIEYLESTKWWNWDLKTIKENKNFFEIQINDIFQEANSDV